MCFKTMLGVRGGGVNVTLPETTWICFVGDFFGFQGGYLFFCWPLFGRRQIQRSWFLFHDHSIEESKPTGLFQEKTDNIC